MTITITRGDIIGIPFTITDPGNNLLSKRVTWAVGDKDQTPIVKKTGALPGSTADITITTQLAGQITGTINMSDADYDLLPDQKYWASLWVDDGGPFQRCVTPSGTEILRITPAVPRD